MKKFSSSLEITFSGNVTSPNYPNNYPDRLEKTELVQVEQGMILSIEFLAFDIDFDPVLCDLNCNCDHLTITDGDGTTLMGKSCGSSLNSSTIFEGRLIGSSLPPAIVTRSNSISITFKTGSLGSRSGWSISWKAVTPGMTKSFKSFKFNPFIRVCLPFPNLTHRW